MDGVAHPDLHRAPRRKGGSDTRIGDLYDKGSKRRVWLHRMSVRVRGSRSGIAIGGCMCVPVLHCLFSVHVYNMNDMYSAPMTLPRRFCKIEELLVDKSHLMIVLINY